MSQAAERVVLLTVGLVSGVALCMSLGWVRPIPPTPRSADASLPSDAAVADAHVPDLPEMDAGALPVFQPLSPIDRGLKSVRIGVVIVQFAGAQRAPASARTKSAAFEAAQHLAADAKTDFHGAVQRGDSGSIDDLGRIAKGILEPNIESAVFALPSGGVSEVLEAPTGFWIVKRLD